MFFFWQNDVFAQKHRKVYLILFFEVPFLDIVFVISEHCIALKMQKKMSGIPNRVKSRGNPYFKNLRWKVESVGERGSFVNDLQQQLIVLHSTQFLLLKKSSPISALQLHSCDFQ